MPSSIAIYAGTSALRQIKEHGINAEQINMMAGASGGPKWFTLFGLDKYLFGEFFKDRQQPLYTIGSSAGAWRMACLAQKDPVAAISRLAKYYSEETYSEDPSTEEISDKAIKLVDKLLGESGAKEIVENSMIQTHLIVARAKGLASSEVRIGQMMGLILAAGLNAINDKTLPWFFERYNFHNQNPEVGFHKSFFDYDQSGTQYHKLTENNVKQVLLASGAIPMVLRGIKKIEGAPFGVYRDGGIIDYHFDVQFPKDGLILYPHFHPLIKKGWFDKGLKYRRANVHNFDNVILITPSSSHIEKLPFGKISDRTDFADLDTKTRIDYWQTVLFESEHLAEDFSNLVEFGKGLEKIQSIETIL